MLKIAICDDDRNDLNIFSNYIKRNFYVKKKQCLIYEYTNPELMLEKDREIIFDVFFLDIILKGINGFEIANRIKLYNDKAYIIFMTIKQDLVFDSFKCMPFGFLCKNKMECIEAEIDNIMFRIEYLRNKEKNLVFELPYTERKIVSCREIVILYSHRNYVIVCLNSGEEFQVRGTIKNWEESLKDTHIARVNRTCLVNMDYILKMDKHNIYISDNKAMSLGKKYMDTFCQKFFEMKRIRG